LQKTTWCCYLERRAQRLC